MFDEGPVSWQLGHAGCGAITFTGVHGKPEDCTGKVTHVGLVLNRTGRPPRWRLWISFSCARHYDRLDAARPLLERDQAVLDRWVEQQQLALAGKRYERPEPLAVGAEAKELHRRALEWARRQGELRADSQPPP